MRLGTDDDERRDRAQEQESSDEPRRAVGHRRPTGKREQRFTSACRARGVGDSAGSIDLAAEIPRLRARALGLLVVAALLVVLVVAAAVLVQSSEDLLKICSIRSMSPPADAWGLSEVEYEPLGSRPRNAHEHAGILGAFSVGQH